MAGAASVAGAASIAGAASLARAASLPGAASAPGATLASTSGQPEGFQSQVNSGRLLHSSGLEAHWPPVLVKHHPHPSTGVHVPQVVYCEQYPLLPDGAA